MPSCFYILQRMFVRVDGVLLRLNETRIYHAFDTNHVLREYTSREDRYQTVCAVSSWHRVTHAMLCRQPAISDTQYGWWWHGDWQTSSCYIESLTCTFAENTKVEGS
jgi:hypothetical protein